MQVVDHLSQVSRSELGELAFVPTMGALHLGHAALIRQGEKLTKSVVVSIFVNPLQFDDHGDFDKYPRTPQMDIAIAEESGAQVLWIPDYDEIYPGPIHRLDPGPIGALYEGAMRTGHFEGMLTAVKRLFELVKPSWALFGEKDFQQLFLIRKMVQELSLGIEIVAVPTVREASGLAISSRNIRLDPNDRQVALVISRALTNASQMATLDAMRLQLEKTLVSEPGFTCEYAVIIDETDFSPATESTLKKRALVAGWVNGVRLIDNMPMAHL
jgi:pantoate--beta-alanine ligase